MDKSGNIKDFMLEHFKHFNAAALVDAARGYETHLAEGKRDQHLLALGEVCFISTGRVNQGGGIEVLEVFKHEVFYVA